MVVTGFGSYAWSNPLDIRHTTAKLFLSWNVLYVVLIHVTKASILTQYLRIFPTRTMRRLTWLLFATLLPSLFWGVFASIFICNPVKKVWRPMTPGHCLGTRTYWLSVTSVNIVLDFAVLALPIPVISRLKLPRRQKIALVGVFLLGFFTCAVSIVRLVVVHNAYARHNYTASSAEAVTWSMVEANVGIICASLLALKPLITFFFPQATKERQPPRWSLTLDTISTIAPSEPDVEKGPVREQASARPMVSDERLEKIAEELEDSDELTLVGTRQSYMGSDARRVRTKSWSEQTILDMEGVISRPESAATSPLTAHMLEEEVEAREQRAALDLRRGSKPGKGYDK
ncbi:hypothetical protein D6D19_01020 [Aureobasidium pullulans]|uniref:Rhodopsin domain-containing protein n=1 Tax=Aureobasidium pullulans TaxID=5580 RepID=A0A4S9AJI5_AURPU|nr:hypothetical protein D6D19_01020 [Aureobasidium pullulans]